ncbi:hypothetical protein LMG31506_03036 [Cupriavidus yeoncheonensis]|uniref:Putative exodeoxyribonuclease 8 PDDEXK-like domain-containing protein n=1 Tax=Cupriavidus yeoncheonensis TaxID=1462994 RepID=A0A916IUQ8_9BURK|nr:PD-(D/E)XK nuclease-like domain-containing protein [Cupriavidus yeoncheonensis]CAG2144573.1 hypothetical protein LMG31506_03036 [Cupriavidus yeoncheonensis]
MNPGVYDTISNADYHGGEGVSNSMLSIIDDSSPCHLKAVREAREAANESGEKREPSPAFLIGSAFHALVLEPAVFAKEYCLGLRQQDVPDAIDDREQLVAMVAELNAGRLPKIPTSGSKAELAERLRAADAENGVNHPIEDVMALTVADLKAELEAINKLRPGMLSTSGSRHELAEILRANGRQIKLWSDVKEEWLKNNGHRSVLTQEQWDQVHAMRDSVMKHPAASALLSGKGFAELSVYWKDPETGELCRCRPDFWRADGIVVDLKSTEDASPAGFSRSMGKYHYHVQHPFYTDGINLALQQGGEAFGCEHPTSAKAFVFVACEKHYPYAVGVYALDPASVELGRATYRRHLNTYAECLRTGVWPAYGERIESISLPDWQLRRAELAA